MTSVFTQNAQARNTWFKKRKKDASSRTTVGKELEFLELDHAVKTDQTENQKRRTLNVTRQHDQSWGFTLQSYGIHHTKTQEVEILTYVDYVDFGSPAYVAGMQAGDVILSINGVSMEGADHTSLIEHIKGQDDSMRIVVLFEDCVRKVELHLRLRRLKNLLAAKEFELRSLELREKRIVQGLGSLSDSRWSLRSSISSTNFAVARDTHSLQDLGISPMSSPQLRYKRPNQTHDDSGSSFNDVTGSDVVPSPSDPILDTSMQSCVYEDGEGWSSPNMVLNPRVDLKYTSLPSNARTRDRHESHVGNSKFYSPSRDTSNDESREFDMDSIHTEDSVFGHDISRDCGIYQTWTGAAPDISRDSGIYNTWSGGRGKKRRGETRSIGNSLFYVESEENLTPTAEKADPEFAPMFPENFKNERDISHIDYDKMGARPKSKYSHSTCSDSQLSIRNKKDKNVKLRERKYGDDEELSFENGDHLKNSYLVNVAGAQTRRPSSLPIIPAEEEMTLSLDIATSGARDSRTESPVFSDSITQRSIPQLEFIPAEPKSQTKCDKNSKHVKQTNETVIKNKHKHVPSESPKDSPLMGMKKLFQRSPSMPSLHLKSKWSPLEFTRNKLRSSLKKLRRKSGSYKISDSKLSLAPETDFETEYLDGRMLTRSASAMTLGYAPTESDIAEVEVYATLPKVSNKTKELKTGISELSCSNTSQDEELPKSLHSKHVEPHREHTSNLPDKIEDTQKVSVTLTTDIVNPMNVDSVSDIIEESEDNVFLDKNDNIEVESEPSKEGSVKIISNESLEYVDSVQENKSHSSTIQCNRNSHNTLSDNRDNACEAYDDDATKDSTTDTLPYVSITYRSEFPINNVSTNSSAVVRNEYSSDIAKYSDNGMITNEATKAEPESDLDTNSLISEDELSDSESLTSEEPDSFLERVIETSAEGKIHEKPDAPSNYAQIEQNTIPNTRNTVHESLSTDSDIQDKFNDVDGNNVHVLENDLSQKDKYEDKIKVTEASEITSLQSDSKDFIEEPSIICIQTGALVTERVLLTDKKHMRKYSPKRSTNFAQTKCNENYEQSSRKTDRAIECRNVSDTHDKDNLHNIRRNHDSVQVVVQPRPSARDNYKNRSFDKMELTIKRNKSKDRENDKDKFTYKLKTAKSITKTAEESELRHSIIHRPNTRNTPSDRSYIDTPETIDDKPQEAQIKESKHRLLSTQLSRDSYVKSNVIKTEKQSTPPWKSSDSKYSHTPKGNDLHSSGTYLSQTKTILGEIMGKPEKDAVRPRKPSGKEDADCDPNNEAGEVRTRTPHSNDVRYNLSEGASNSSNGLSQINIENKENVNGTERNVQVPGCDTNDEGKLYAEKSIDHFGPNKDQRSVKRSVNAEIPTINVSAPVSQNDTEIMITHSPQFSESEESHLDNNSEKTDSTLTISKTISPKLAKGRHSRSVIKGGGRSARALSETSGARTSESNSGVMLTAPAKLSTYGAHIISRSKSPEKTRRRYGGTTKSRFSFSDDNLDDTHYAEKPTKTITPVIPENEMELSNDRFPRDNNSRNRSIGGSANGNTYQVRENISLDKKPSSQINQEKFKPKRRSPAINKYENTHMSQSKFENMKSKFTSETGSNSKTSKAKPSETEKLKAKLSSESDIINTRRKLKSNVPHEPEAKINKTYISKTDGSSSRESPKGKLHGIVTKSVIQAATFKSRSSSISESDTSTSTRSRSSTIGSDDTLSISERSDNYHEVDDTSTGIDKRSHSVGYDKTSKHLHSYKIDDNNANRENSKLGSSNDTLQRNSAQNRLNKISSVDKQTSKCYLVNSSNTDTFNGANRLKVNNPPKLEIQLPQQKMQTVVGTTPTCPSDSQRLTPAIENSRKTIFNAIQMCMQREAVDQEGNNVSSLYKPSVVASPISKTSALQNVSNVIGNRSRISKIYTCETEL